jgi:tetratricopeptide (TPR) repeat protein
MAPHAPAASTALPAARKRVMTTGMNRPSAPIALAWSIAASAGCASAPRPITPTPTAVRDGARPSASPRDALLSRARVLAAQGAYESAAGLYRLALAQSPADDEARAGLARTHAWSGRYEDAAALYRDILRRHPDDAEVRAGLVDTLLWRSLWSSARAELDEGLSRAPNAEPLLARRARLLAWSGDPAAAREAARRGLDIDPNDSSLRELDDRTFLGEARVVARNDFFPPGWSDTRALDVFVRHTLGRFTLAFHSEQSERLITGGTSYNGSYALTGAYSFAPGWGASLEVGVGAPAPVIPRWFGRAEVGAPLGRLASLALSYALWGYDAGQLLHLAAPTLAIQARDDLRLELRYWLAVAAFPALDPRVVHSAMLRGSWRMVPRLDLGFEYGYGAQIDRVPTPEMLTALVSHLGAISLDWLADRAFGLRPLYRFEHRTNQSNASAIVIHSAELGVYTRW